MAAAKIRRLDIRRFWRYGEMWLHLRTNSICIFGKMSSGSTRFFEVDYPCWRWYLWLVWFYIFLPIIVISVALWIKGDFSVISCVVLVLFLQLLWLPRLIKDIWVPYAVSIEEDRVVVYTRVGKRIKENSLELKNLGVKYFKRRKALTLWEREENSTPHKMFYLSKNTNWSASTIEEVKHSLLSISHNLIHSEEV